MFAAALSGFWPAPPKAQERPAPPRKRPAPVLIGDAVQPFAGETLLLALLRAEAEKKDAQP
jgi:hypothetical protein